MERIAVVAMAGGEGRTTVTRELASLLAREGKRVAVIDADPLQNLSVSLGVFGEGKPDLNHYSLQSTFFPTVDQTAALSLPAPTQIHGFDFWPAAYDLATLDRMLYVVQDRIKNLKFALDSLDQDYDFIFIDTRSISSPLLIAILLAVDSILIPVSTLRSLGGIRFLRTALRQSADILRAPKVRAFLPMRYTDKSKIGQYINNFLQDQHTTQVTSSIRESHLIQEASAMTLPLVEYSPRAEVTKDFKRVMGELFYK